MDIAYWAKIKQTERSSSLGQLLHTERRKAVAALEVLDPKLAEIYRTQLAAEDAVFDYLQSKYPVVE